MMVIGAGSGVIGATALLGEQVLVLGDASLL